MFGLGLIIGSIIGGIVGMIGIALFIINRDEEEE